MSEEQIIKEKKKEGSYRGILMEFGYMEVIKWFWSSMSWHVTLNLIKSNLACETKSSPSLFSHLSFIFLQYNM